MSILGIGNDRFDSRIIEMIVKCKEAKCQRGKVLFVYFTKNLIEISKNGTVVNL